MSTPSNLKFYLAGPMSGLPQFNFPAFHKAAKALRARGFDIVSPAELDGAEVEAEAMKSPDGEIGPTRKMCGLTWADMLARDVKLVADEVDGIILLPGWEKSRGAKLECYVGLLTGKIFLQYLGEAHRAWLTTPISEDQIRARVLP